MESRVPSVRICIPETNNLNERNSTALDSNWIEYREYYAKKSFFFATMQENLISNIGEEEIITCEHFEIMRA